MSALLTALDRFKAALGELPDVVERMERGQQFNAYDLVGSDQQAVCIGPITSRPLSLAEAAPDVAELIVAALRVASTAALSQSTTGRTE